MKKNTRYLINGIGQRAEGFYKVQVVDAATNRILRSMPMQRNLILNQGMEHVASDVWCNCFLYGVAGTGTRPNSIDSLTDTAAQTGTTVTNTGAHLDFTTACAVGDMIRWANGVEARITSITNINHMEVTPSQSVTGQAYVIWKTAQVGLDTEVKRSITYLLGSPNCGTVRVGTSNVLQHTRTWDFTAEVGLVTYTEVGVAWNNTNANTVFSRILLVAPVPVDVGQKLRLIYQLNITYTPSTPVVKNLPVANWPVAPSTVTTGQECIQTLCASAVNASTGATTTFAGFAAALDPGGLGSISSNGRSFAITSDTTALQPFGTAVDRTLNGSMLSVQPTNSVYVPLSFSLDTTGVFQVAEANRNDLRSLIMGVRSNPNFTPFSASQQAFVFLFDQNQTKTNTQTLSFTIRMTWSRVLA